MAKVDISGYDFTITNYKNSENILVYNRVAGGTHI